MQECNAAELSIETSSSVSTLSATGVIGEAQLMERAAKT